MGMIDADAHVFENPRTWEYLQEDERQFTPRMVEQVYGTDRRGLAGNLWKRYWLIGTKVHGIEGNINVNIDKPLRDLEDIEARVAHMDRLGVDVQVIYPSLFLHPYTKNQRMEYALTRSYNRWMADNWKRGKGRLRWVAVVPTMQIDKAREQIEFAHDNGACGILLHGVELDKMLSDPYFFPLYEKMDELGSAVCVHAGYYGFTFGQVFEGTGGLLQFRYPVIAAFHTLMMQNVPGRFPNIRWGFMEAGCQWVPLAIQDLAVRYRELLDDELPGNLFADRNVYVTCQADDDVPYVLKFTGEDALVVGTDYSHFDHAADMDAFTHLKEKSGVSPDVVEKILSGNPRRLYALT